MPEDPFADEAAGPTQESRAAGPRKEPPGADMNPEEVDLGFRLSGRCGIAALTVFLAALAVRGLEDRYGEAVLELLLGYCLGTLLATGMLAVIWPALGAGKWRYRASFALVWVVGLFITILVTSSAAAGGRGPPPEFLLGLVVVLLCAWALPQAPLWAVRRLAGLHFAKPDAAGQENEKQFSIGYLLALTGGIALFLGVLRAALLQLDFDATRDMEGMFLFIAFVGVGFLLCFALYLASLLHRHALASVVAVLLLAGVASYFEFNILSLITNMRFGPGRVFFMWVNAFAAIWTLIYALAMRSNGYRLVQIDR